MRSPRGRCAASAAWCRCACAAAGEAARELCASTKVFILAESLGRCRVADRIPSDMTHASTAGSQLEVPDDLVRLSVGIEDVADLLADLEQALSLAESDRRRDAPATCRGIHSRAGRGLGVIRLRADQRDLDGVAVGHRVAAGLTHLGVDQGATQR